MPASYNSNSDRPPLYLKQRTSTAFITVTVAFAIFTDVFVYGIIVPVIPFALHEQVGLPESDTQFWTSILLAIYGGALFLTAPICGCLADRSKSRRIPLLFGLLALAGSTALLCAGRTIGVIAAGRALQGMSAAVVWVVGLALLVDTVGCHGIGQAMGYVGLAVSLGVLSAPLLGGIIFERAGYYSVWAVAFGLIGLDIILRLIMIERKIAVEWDPCYQPKRAVMGGETENEQKTTPKEFGARTEGAGSDNKNTVPSSEESLVFCAVRNEHLHGQEKTVDGLPSVLRLLASRRLLSALFAVMIQSALLTSFDAILPIFTQSTFGWNATGAGLVFLPFMAPTFTSPLIGHLSDKYGPRWYVTAGFFGCGPCLILLRLVVHNTLQHKIVLCVLLAFTGLFLALALTPLMAEITYAVMEKEKRRPNGYFGENGAYAQAYSLSNIAWAAGCMMGPLLAGMVVDSAGWSTATLILGCVSFSTALPAVIWTGGSLRKKRSGEIHVADR